MSKAFPILRSLSLVNLNGITVRTLDLVELQELLSPSAYSSFGNTVSLLGENGAGKTTILGAYQLALMGDIRFVSLGTSDTFQKTQKLADSEMFHRLGNPSMVALEVQTRSQQRHLYLIHAKKSSGINIEMTRMRLVLPKGVEPMSCLALQEGHSWRPLTPHMVRDTAASLGCELTTYESVEGYLLDLFNDGILPKPLQKDKDKANYAQVFHSAMSGRLDSNIERNLSSYLMSHSRGNIKGVVDVLQDSMRVVRQTRIELSKNSKDYTFFKQLLEHATKASSFGWAVAEKQLILADEQLESAQGARIAANEALDKAQATVKKLGTELEQLRQTRDTLEQKRNKTEERLRLAMVAADEFTRRERFKQDLNTLTPEAELAKNAHQNAQQDYKRASEALSQAQQDLAETQQQLADAVKAFEITSERAGKYEFACRQLKAIEAFHGHVDPDNLQDPMQTLAATKTQCGQNLNVLERQLQQMNEILETYHQFSKQLSIIGETVDPNNLQDWVQAKKRHLQESQLIAANEPYEKEKSQALNIELETQQKYRTLLTSTELENQPDSVPTFMQAVTLYRQKVDDAGQNVVAAKTQCDELLKQQQRLNIELVQTEAKHETWSQLQPQVRLLTQAYPDQASWTGNDCLELQKTLRIENDALTETITEHSAAILKFSADLQILRDRDSSHLELLRTLAADVDGLPICDLFNDIDPEDARYMEAALGSLMSGILVEDPHAASRTLLATYGDDWPLEDLVLIPSGRPISQWNESFEDKELFEDITAAFIGADESTEAPWCVLTSGEGLRISQLRDAPVLGDKAREALITRLESQIERHESDRSDATDAHATLTQHIEALRMAQPKATVAFADEPELDAAKTKIKDIERALSQAKMEHQSLCNTEDKVKHSLSILTQCEPFAHSLYRDIAADITVCEAAIARCTEAQLEINQFSPLFKNIDTEWKLLQQPYPNDPISLEKQVLDEQARYEAASDQLRSIETLNEVRFHLGKTYSQAKALLGGTSHKQDALKEQAKQIASQTIQLECNKGAAETSRDSAQKRSIEVSTKLNHLESELGRVEVALKDIGIDYSPGLETRLQEKKSWLEDEYKSAQRKADTHSESLSKAKEIHQQKRSDADLNLQKEAQARAHHEKAVTERQSVMGVISDDGTTAVLKDTMTSMLELDAINQRDTAFQKARSFISKVNGCAQDYGIPVTDPMLAFGQTLTGTDLAALSHLYCEAVSLLKRRIRQDLIQSGDPQEMLMDLDKACRMARKSLDNAEEMFQTKRSELGDAIAKRITDEQRAVRKLSAQLNGIGFGQVAEVRLITDYVPKFDKVLEALRQGSQIMDDLFADASTVEEALSDLFHRTTAGEIKGEKLLDHRNYLRVKTQIRRRGRNEYEDLEGSQLSTGERLGSGLIVLISIIKHWGSAGHGKKPFAIPLVMDEVSRLDAQSQATVAELCRRCGVQLLMAAPETLGKITGLGYQLVRVWPDGVNLDNPSQDDEARSWVQITGLQDSTELTVDSEYVLNGILGKS